MRTEPPRKPSVKERSDEKVLGARRGHPSGQAPGAGLRRKVGKDRAGRGASAGPQHKLPRGHRWEATKTKLARTQGSAGDRPATKTAGRGRKSGSGNNDTSRCFVTKGCWESCFLKLGDGEEVITMTQAQARESGSRRLWSHTSEDKRQHRELAEQTTGWMYGVETEEEGLKWIPGSRGLGLREEGHTTDQEKEAPERYLRATVREKKQETGTLSGEERSSTERFLKDQERPGGGGVGGAWLRSSSTSRHWLGRSLATTRPLPALQRPLGSGSRYFSVPSPSSGQV